MRDNQTTTTDYEYLVIGAGPAGLQMGYFLQQSNRKYLILESGDSPGTFFKRFPRHRTLISNNKVYTGYDDPEINMRFDWNSLLSDSDEMLFKNYSKAYFPRADDFVRYLKDFADHFRLNIQYNSRVAKISKPDHFVVIDEKGHAFSAPVLIVASGFSKPYMPNIPGIETVEQYSDVSVDPMEFKNQKVLVIGKGNSGFETAENLIETAAVIHVASPTPLQLAWKTHFVGHLRAVNNNFLDTYQLKSQNVLIDATIEKIEQKDGKYYVWFDYTHAHNEREALVYDRIIACTGFAFDDSIFDPECRPTLTINNRFPQQTSQWESVNVEALYFAGTLTQMRDFKKTTSGFIHGFRYNVKALNRLFEQKYHGIQWPNHAVESNPAAISNAILKRVNSSSALWQQFGFLCDVIALSPEGEARYFEEMPVDYVADNDFAKNGHYYTVTLEFGKIEGDPFNILRFPDPKAADRSTFLHPIIRHYRGAEFISEHHLLEDLSGEWQKETLHIRPLLQYVTGEMDGALVLSA